MYVCVNFFPPVFYCVCARVLASRLFVRRCATGAGVRLGGFLITQAAISRCSASMVPCSWSCFRWSAASMDATHCRLVCSGNWS